MGIALAEFNIFDKAAVRREKGRRLFIMKKVLSKAKYLKECKRLGLGITVDSRNGSLYCIQANQLIAEAKKG